MIKTFTVDNLDEKDISKKLDMLEKLKYKLHCKKVYKLKLSDLEVAGNKIFNLLHNIDTLGDVSKLTLQEVKKLKSIGPKAVASLSDTMYRNGVHYKEQSVAKSKTKTKTKPKVKATEI